MQQRLVAKMAAPLQTENSKLEYYLLLVVIKLAILVTLKTVQSIVNIHTAYKTNLKKKYKARDIEAPAPKNTNK